jgi:hypothetical protein
LADKFRTLVSVEDVITSAPRAVPPHGVSERDFESAIMAGWKNPELDRLGESIAIELVSAPPLMVAVGGAGGITMHHRNSDRELTGIRHSLRGILPAELLELNPHAYFGVAGDYQQYEHIYEHIRSNIGVASSREISYNYTTRVLKLHKVTVSVPILISNSEYKGTNQTADFDTLDYLMNAHVIEPKIDRSTEAILLAYMKEFLDEQKSRFQEYNIEIDPGTIARISSSLCRLRFKREIDRGMISDAEKYASDLCDDFYSYLRHEYPRDRIPRRKSRLTGLRMDEQTPEEGLPKDCGLILSKMWDIFDESKSRLAKEELFSSIVGRVNRKKFDACIKSLVDTGIVSEDSRGLRPLR